MALNLSRVSWPRPSSGSLSADGRTPAAMLHGLDPGTLDPHKEMVLSFLYAYLPKPPISAAVSLSCAANAEDPEDGEGVDRISALPDDILRRVVSRLPAKDGAPALERLFMWRSWSQPGTRIKIGHAPVLNMLGYLEPGVHVLEIGNTIIKSETKPSPNTSVPSVRMLALHLHFGLAMKSRCCRASSDASPTLKGCALSLRKLVNPLETST